MKKVYLSFLLLLIAFIQQGFGAIQPTIMVIPYTKSGEDIRTVMDNDINKRLAIAKVKEGFDNKGYTTVDFIGKLKAANDNQVFTSDNQSDIKSKIISMSGCDIYVVVDVDMQSDNSGSSANVILTSYDVSTGNSFANKVASSGKFFTSDMGHLIAHAVDKCIDDFVTMMDTKFAEIAQKGNVVYVDFSFGGNSAYNMKTLMPKSNNLALSDVLENWVSNNSLDRSYHIQGTTNLKMIFDRVKIPIKDDNDTYYNANKYALKVYNFITSLGIAAEKDVKANTIYITIN